MTTNCIEMHWTCGSIEEARKISRFLVQERLVACAKIVPWAESIYLWNGQLETAQESLVSLKTSKDRYEEVKKVILDNCSYQVPEITYTHIDGGSADYLHWVEETTSQKAASP